VFASPLWSQFLRSSAHRFGRVDSFADSKHVPVRLSVQLDVFPESVSYSVQLINII